MNNQNDLQKSNQPARASRFKNTMLAKTAPNWPWMVVFVVLTVFMLIISLRVPNQTNQQEFHFRIIIALAASGLGAIIPGFLELELNWLRNSMRAGGAIGLFVLIYMHNPPKIVDILPPPSPPDLSGTWTYECDAIDKEYKHGGTCTLNANWTEYGMALELHGHRLWLQTGSDPRENIQFNWQSNWGMVTDATKFRFEYNVEKNNGIIHGFAWGDIKTSNDKPTILEGNFYQVPPTDPLFGHMVFTKQ